MTRMGKEVSLTLIEEIIKELNIPDNKDLKIDFKNFKRIILDDPIAALKAKEDLHPLFILEEEVEHEMNA